MKKLLKNKSAVIFILFLLFVICVSFISKGSGDICGQWEVNKKSIDELSSVYSEKILIIYEDGTALFDGSSVSYSKNDDTITFSTFWESRTFEYKVSGNKLMLRYVEKEDYPQVYYDKVS